MAFGKKLEAALQMKNMKPGTLATKTGISKNTIYSIIQRDSTKVDLSVIRVILMYWTLISAIFFRQMRRSKKNYKKTSSSKSMSSLKKIAGL